VTLSSSLTPLKVTHSSTRKCKCIPIQTDEEIRRLAANAQKALEEGILVSEKPAIAFAMILLGAEVAY
jgi:hypothetical protein